MSRGIEFYAWFAEQFPHHAEAMNLDLYEARREADSIERAAAIARAKADDIESAMAAKDIALKAWVARRMK